MPDKTVGDHAARNKDHAPIVVKDCVAKNLGTIPATVVTDRSGVMDITLVFFQVGDSISEVSFDNKYFEYIIIPHSSITLKIN